MNGNSGDSVRITRATLALIIAVAAPVATGAVAEYRLRRVESTYADQEQRTRDLEKASIRLEQAINSIREQNEQITDLRREVRELTRQVDKLR